MCIRDSFCIRFRTGNRVANSKPMNMQRVTIVPMGNIDHSVLKMMPKDDAWRMRLNIVTPETLNYRDANSRIR